MKKIAIIVSLIFLLAFFGIYNHLTNIDTNFSDENEMEDNIETYTDDIQESEYISDEPIIHDEQTTLAQDLLFSEDFSSSLSNWAATMNPTIEDGALTTNSFQLTTIDSFSSKNGLELSFEVMYAKDNPSGGFSIKLVEKSYASNYASLIIRPFGDMVYYIEGHCVTPTPRVTTIMPPDDSKFHTFTFRVHTDGTAEWIQDGYVQFQRTKFDIGGDYNIMLSGSSLIGSSESNVFLDNVKLISLNEASPSFDICKEISHTPAKNPCPAGKCLSNGICCWKGSPYYCNGYCYVSREEAMSQSQGRCSEWKIIC